MPSRAPFVANRSAVIPPTVAVRFADRIALTTVMLIPLLLLHAHGIAEVAIGIADVCFLVRSALVCDWSWLRPSWMRISLLWWAWLVVCSAPIPGLGLGEAGWGGLVQAVAIGRFLVLIAALQHAVLRERRARRWMFALIAAAVAWIAAQSLLQAASGHNLWGHVRGRDGELTGPFAKPRAGPPLARLLFPVLVPAAARLLARPGVLARAGAYALLLGGMCVMVLIGQRMPVLITGLGLVVVGLLLRRLRPVVLAAGLAGLALVAASAAVSPPAYHRLVLKFDAQMQNFPTTQYGELAARAWAIGVQHPLTGRGVEGFRTGCMLPRYFRPTFDGRIGDGGGAVICANHPHNFYLEALDDGGFPGLALFSATALAWMAPLAGGLWRRPDPLRVGLFASVLIQLWPLASTSAFISMPMGGWLFLLLGWGLAEARWRQPAQTVDRARSNLKTNVEQA
ncbi:MAG: O-antigen ligase family protein [Pseudomonadota bacterium]|nr:O-antigen ligase family protein [Pseudomonadota bacterium]